MSIRKETEFYCHNNTVHEISDVLNDNLILFIINIFINYFFFLKRRKKICSAQQINVVHMNDDICVYYKCAY